MKRQSLPWDTFLLVAMMLVASVCAQAQAAQDDASPKAEATEDVAAEELTYWIGIRGRSIESAVLRTHLQLAEDMGVVIEEVLDNSPAAKAGLRKHDILLRANGDAVDNMQVLQSLVRASKEKPLELKIIRLGKQEKISLVPEVLPKEMAERQRAAARPLRGLNGRRMDAAGMQQLLAQLGMRDFGPGMAFRPGEQQEFQHMQGGVSISVRRNNDGPAHITVKQGDKIWRIEGNDEEALKKLPENLRPQVEQLLKRPNSRPNSRPNNRPNNRQGNRQGFDNPFDLRDFEAEIEGILPRGMGGLGPQGGPFDLQGDPIQKRVEQLEKRFQQLQKRVREEEPAELPDRTT